MMVCFRACCCFDRIAFAAATEAKDGRDEEGDRDDGKAAGGGGRDSDAGDAEDDEDDGSCVDDAVSLMTNAEQPLVGDGLLAAAGRRCAIIGFRSLS